MKKIFTILILLTVVTSGFAQTRVIVMSDIGGSDPDDTQSLVHLLVTLDQIELEGFISQHAWVPYGQGAIRLINGIIDRYESVQSNLIVHSKDFPTAEYLRSIVKEGQKEAAMKGTGKGKDSDGSEWIIKVVDEDDPRPVWISAWSGMNTLAQALIKVRDTRTPEELEQFVNKIRIYDVLGQDDAGAWIVRNFPDLIYIRNKEIYGWAPADEWTRENVQNVGPLGQIYPNRIWATEGDSPSFFYCFDNGLNVPERPDYGGWGGRFDLTRKEGIRSMDWVVRNNLDETQYDPYHMLPASSEGGNAINIWKQEIFNDFAARMLWTVTDSYTDANHHPVAVFGRETGKDIIYKRVKAGHSLKLDASRSADPDGNDLTYEWIYYKEPGTYKGTLDILQSESVQTIIIPDDAKGKTIHIVLKVTDNGKPSLTSYRRIVLECR